MCKSTCQICFPLLSKAPLFFCSAKFPLLLGGEIEYQFFSLLPSLPPPPSPNLPSAKSSHISQQPLLLSLSNPTLFSGISSPLCADIIERDLQFFLCVCVCSPPSFSSFPSKEEDEGFFWGNIPLCNFLAPRSMHHMQKKEKKSFSSPTKWDGEPRISYAYVRFPYFFSSLSSTYILMT